MGRPGLQRELHLDRPHGRVPVQRHDPVLPRRQRVPERADRLRDRHPALARLRHVRGGDAPVGRRLRVRLADAAPGVRDDVVVQQHRLVVHLRRRSVGVLRPVRAGAVPAHRRRDVRLEHPHRLGEHAGRRPRHVHRRGTPHPGARAGLLLQPDALLPHPERALPVRDGQHPDLDRRLRGEQSRRRGERHQLDLRRRQREERVQGGDGPGAVRPPQHDPPDDVALPRAGVQPIVGLHRRRGAARKPHPALVDAGCGDHRHRRADGAHMVGPLERRVRPLERARQRLRRQPRPLVDARLQRDRGGRQRPDLDRRPRSWAGSCSGATPGSPARS